MNDDRWVGRLTLFVVLSGAVLRLLLLEADPVYEYWSGYLSDEARWVEHGRRLVLFGSIDFDTWYSKVHLMLAPLFQAATALSFASLGVGFASARLVSALSGILSLIAATLFLRRRLSSEGLLLTAIVLALQPDLLFLSRVAIPEAAAMLFELLAFLVIVSAPRSVKRAAAGGVLAAAALGCKATTFPIVPIMAVVTWSLHDAADRRARWSRTLAFIGGVAVPGMIVLVSAKALNLVPDLNDLSYFLRPASLFRVGKFFFGSYFMEVVFVLLLGCWTVGGLLIAGGRIPKSVARDIFIGSAIWIVGWLGVSALLEYFPLYYTFHVLVPIGVNLGAGLTILQSRDTDLVVDGLAGLQRARAKIAAVWLLTPLAVLLAALTYPLMVASGKAAGIDTARLSYTMGLTAVVHLTLATIALIWRSRSLLHAAVLVPLFTAFFWVLGDQVAFYNSSFWGNDGVHSVALVAVGLSLSVGIVAVMPSRSLTGCLTWKWVPRYLFALAFVWGIRTVPKFAFPTYTLADTSSALASVVEAGASVGTPNAESLFLGNEIDISTWKGPTYWTPSDPPEFLVLVHDFVMREELNGYGYRQLRQYRVELGRLRHSGLLEGPGYETVLVFKRTVP